MSLLKRLFGSAIADDDSASEKGWYLATAHDNRVRQVVLTLPPTCVRESKFQGLMLFPHYRVTQKDWITEVFTLDGDPGPYLIVRADNVTAKLRGHVTRMAFAFCHMKSSGILSIFVNVDCPPSTCREIGFANIGFEYAIGAWIPNGLSTSMAASSGAQQPTSASPSAPKAAGSISMSQLGRG